ncbi:MAG: hypothetical protein AAGA27_01565 [Pseudomonadota bacterium]
MNKKFNVCMLFVLLLLLKSTSYATVNSLANPHFCLPDANGNPPVGCTGMLFTKNSISDFAQFYKNLPVLHSGWNKQPRVVPFLLFSTSQTPLNMVTKQTAETLKYNTYNPVVYNWHNISKLVYFGGSENEGQILIPTPGWIKAAHQNGSAIFATIFFSPNSYGGSDETNQLDYMLTLNKSGHYPIADLLISAARKYHIDGYFINEEAFYLNDKSSINLSAFVRYIEKTSKEEGYPIKIEWYFTALKSETPFYENNNGLNAFAANSVFIENWSLDSNTINKAISMGYPEANIEYGTQRTITTFTQNICVACNLHFLPNKNISAAVFAFSDILSPNHLNENDKPSQQYKNAMRFWRITPSYLKNSNNLDYGTNNFFATDFNAGIGRDYYIQGVRQHYGFWSAIGLQDILPINFLSDTPGLKISLDFNDAYNGGSSLRIIKRQIIPISKPHHITLYDHLNVSIKNNPVMYVTYKQLIGDTPFKICVNYTDGDNKGDNCISLTSEEKHRWTRSSINLTPLNHQGRYQSIELVVPKSSIKEKTVIGQLYLGSLENYVRQPSSVQELQLKQSIHDDDNNGMHYIISWKGNQHDKNYKVYVNDQFYGATFQNIEDVMVSPPEQDLNICVAPQGYSGIMGTKNCINVSPSQLRPS